MSKKLSLKRVNEDALVFALPPYKTESVYNQQPKGIHWGTELQGIPDFWKTTKGKGIKIAVLDTGIAPNHPALKDNVLEVADFSDTASNAGDGNGHGTHTAGIIAAKEIVPGLGGIAPLARLLVGKVLDDNGKGTPRGITNGISWAIENGADLIVINFGSQLEFAPMKLAVQKASRSGAILLCSAGDCGPDWGTINFPGNNHQVITVGALPCFLPPRPAPVYPTKLPDILAPFFKVTSTFPPMGYVSIQGAATATAIVAGIAALALSKHRQYGGHTPIQSKDDLLEHLKRLALPFQAFSDKKAWQWQGLLKSIDDPEIN